jgi:type II secretory pathway pseudopilin PulG
MKSECLGAKQKGVALIIFVFITALVLTAYMLKLHTSSKLKVEQDKKTQQALTMAKQALLSYSTEEITSSARVPPSLRCIDKNGDGMIAVGDAPYEPKNCNCGLNCIRPGDLPCPDLNNDGEAETACNSQASRLGRLPWKTLGVGDIRDGAGERLWYAVSNRYKNNPRVLPLNSETIGTVSLRNATGALVNNGLATSGLVAVIVSPGQALTRLDGLVQSRSAANQNNSMHYLDIAFGEDNANFDEGNTNGFILGPIKVMQNNQMVTISNDIVLPITRDEINAVMELRVMIEVEQAINYFNSVNGANPDPADLADVTCLNNPIINDNSNANCASDPSVMLGRLPAGENATAPSIDIWASIDANSILRGESDHNWFQQNGWRALLQIHKSMHCAVGESKCRDVNPQATIRISN